MQNDTFSLNFDFLTFILINWCQKCFKVAPELSIYIVSISLKTKYELKKEKKKKGMEHMLCGAIDVLKTSHT